jgi:hypothetical protein
LLIPFGMLPSSAHPLLLMPSSFSSLLWLTVFPFCSTPALLPCSAQLLHAILIITFCSFYPAPPTLIIYFGCATPFPHPFPAHLL